MSLFTCRNCGYEGKWPGTRCPRCCQARHFDVFALAAAAVVVAVLLWLPAAADTCPGCMPVSLSRRPWRVSRVRPLRPRWMGA